MRAPQLRARVRTGTGVSLISSLFIKSLAVVRIRFQRMLMFLLVEVLRVPRSDSGRPDPVGEHLGHFKTAPGAGVGAEVACRSMRVLSLTDALTRWRAVAEPRPSDRVRGVFSSPAPGELVGIERLGHALASRQEWGVDASE